MQGKRLDSYNNYIAYKWHEGNREREQNVDLQEGNTSLSKTSS